MIFVGLDPGVRACGVAVVNDGALVNAHYAREKNGDDVVSIVARFVSTFTAQAIVGIEWPRTYGGRARRGDTNDLLELAYVVGRLTDALTTCVMGDDLASHVVRVSVDAWKRGVSTDVLAAQLDRPPPLGLTDAERASIIWPAPSLRHNVVDAIALARWLAAWPAKHPGKNLRDIKLL